MTFLIGEEEQSPPSTAFDELTERIDEFVASGLRRLFGGKHQPTASVLIHRLLTGPYSGRGGITRLAKDMEISRPTIYAWKDGKSCGLYSHLFRFALLVLSQYDNEAT